MSTSPPLAGSFTAPARRRNRGLIAALIVLGLLYVLWFRNDDHRIAAWLVFALPPLLLAVGAALHRAAAHFWAGVFALAWFSHGVMVAYSRPHERGLAIAAIALALLVIWAANAPALRARFSRRR